MIRKLAAVSAAIAIAAGAFGAHAVGIAQDWLKTGAFYQLIHAVAALVVQDRAPKQAGLMLAGSGLFAATLYLMALGLPHWLGAITPIGGVMMIAAWLWLAASR
jgi:uncharacterized membrane protein YgdD (TMEM256/DUF423 family)